MSEYRYNQPLRKIGAPKGMESCESCAYFTKIKHSVGSCSKYTVAVINTKTSEKEIRQFRVYKFHLCMGHTPKHLRLD
jgi:hypothetical protein